MPVYNGEFRTQAGQPGSGELLRFGPVLPVEVAIPSALSKYLASTKPSYPPTSRRLCAYRHRGNS